MSATGRLPTTPGYRWWLDLVPRHMHRVGHDQGNEDQPEYAGNPLKGCLSHSISPSSINTAANTHTQNGTDECHGKPDPAMDTGRGNTVQERTHVTAKRHA